MRRNERTATRRLLAAWRGLQAQANHLAVETDNPETLAGISEVRDYISEQIEACETRLFGGPDNAQFATRDNDSHNPLTTEA